MATPDFNGLKLNRSLTANLSRSGLTPTPFQTAIIPLITKGHDVIGVAGNGRDRTLSYLLPVVDRILNRQTNAIEALVLIPSAESAEKALAAAKILTNNTSIKSIAIYGKTASTEQQKTLRRGVEIVIGSPACILDCLWKGLVNLSSLKTCIIDEADTLSGTGLMKDVFNVLMSITHKKQTLLFTAAMPDILQRLSKQFLHNPVTVTNEPVNKPPTAAKPKTKPAPPPKNPPPEPTRRGANTAVLRNLIKSADNNAILVFTHTKDYARRTARVITNAGYHVSFVKGVLPRKGVNAPPKGVPTGPVIIVVVMDNASRGLDMAKIFRVLNDKGGTRHLRNTGRSVNDGKIFSLVTSTDELILFVLDKYLEGPLEQLTV